MLDKLRAVHFRPYTKGLPTFTLYTYDTGRTRGSKSEIAYRLTMRVKGHTTTLFDGDEFWCSPLHAMDSDEAIRDLMGFLTLRPGDTDADYFKDYTQAQLEYCSQHAEALSCEVYSRFGDD